MRAEPHPGHAPAREWSRWEPYARRTSGKAESTHQGGVAYQRYVDAYRGVADSGVAGSHCVACRCVGGVLGRTLRVGIYRSVRGFADRVPVRGNAASLYPLALRASP